MAYDLPEDFGSHWSRSETEDRAYKKGFIEGLEAAAEYHTRRANEWEMCRTEIHNSIDQPEMWQSVLNHRRYAKHILNLRERSDQDGSTNRDGGSRQEDPPQEGP